jgi:hypothetical protein
MPGNIEAQHGYAAHIERRPTGYDWQVTSADGRTARGNAPSPRQCCDLTITTLEALRRVSRRRF